MLERRQWATDLQGTVVKYMEQLKIPGHQGRFNPCLAGSTSWGGQIALGYSCFGLKIYFTLGLWDKLGSEERTGWTDYIKSFQIGEQAGLLAGAFVDPVVDEYLLQHTPCRQRLHELLHPLTPGHRQRTRVAETKQAIASLAQVSVRPLQSYRAIPCEPKHIERYLRLFDWRQPWGAGAQFANLAALLSIQGPNFLETVRLREAKSACARFVESLVDRDSGGYFRGRLPEHGMLVNGAMKVLTGLHWLDCSIHYPERLIDLCLAKLPRPDGCHLVDAIYVLHRCAGQTEHRRAEVQRYAVALLDMIKRHQCSDGGFSYNVGSSQTSYYGVPISLGKPEGDIHGTALLLWAVAMILELLEDNAVGFRVLQP